MTELLDRSSLARLRRTGLREVWRQLLLELGDISLAQAAALFYVEDQEDATVHEIAGAIRRSISATSRVVEALVRTGFIDRREDPEDRRAKRVRLTPKARRFFERKERARRERMARVISVLTPAEARQLAGIVERLLEAFVGAERPRGARSGRGGATATPRAS